MSTFGNRARAVASLAALTALAAAISTPVAGAAPPGPCRTANLSLAFDRSRHENGLNHLGVDVVVTNEVAEYPCTLRGYLGLRLYDGHYRPLRTSSPHGDTFFRHDPGPSTVLLRGRHTASAEIEWSHTTSPEEPAAHAKYLRITLPGARGGAFTVPIEQTNPGIYRGIVGTIALS